MACGGVLRWIIGTAFYRQHWTNIDVFFESIGNFGVSDRSGGKLVAEHAMLGHHRRCTVLSYDGVNALYTTKRTRMLAALAKYLPSVARYAANLNARVPAKLLFRIDNGRSQVVQPRKKIAQGCNLGPLCYSSAMVALL